MLTTTGRWNGNYHPAARREEIQSQIERGKKLLLQEIQETALDVRDLMTQEEYDAWWETTPDDNKGFLVAAKAKLEELQAKQYNSFFVHPHVSKYPL